LVVTLRTNVIRAATVALGGMAGYLAVILVLATGDAVGNVLEGDRYAVAAFLVLIAVAVIAGAGLVTWFARRDRHSWWRAARRASFVLIIGTMAVAITHVSLAAPF